MPDERGITIRELWAQTTDAVGARNEARWLCEVATTLDGADFIAALDEQATERMVAHLDSMVARYRTGEPLQYVLGRWSFRHLDLAIDRRVLIPRPETELVAEAAIELANQVDVMFVLGGLHSANTQEMARLCREAGCETFHIETWEQFSPAMVRGRLVAGVTAGASTPEWVINDFVRHLRAVEPASAAGRPAADEPAMRQSRESVSHGGDHARC